MTRHAPAHRPGTTPAAGHRHDRSADETGRAPAARRPSVRAASRFPRLLLGVIGAAFGMMLLLAGAALAYWVTSSSSNAATADAGAIGPAGTPSASVSGRDVTLNWGTATNASAYTVGRSNVSPQSLSTTESGTCASSVSAPTTSCTDTGVAENGTSATNWTYAVTPRLYTWNGPSSATGTVTIPAPTLSLSTATFKENGGTATATVAHYFDSENVTYCVDEDTTSCPAADQAGTGAVPASGGTTQSSVTIPSGLSYGTHTLYAEGSAGSNPTGLSFTISSPTVALGTTTGVTVGSSDSVTGSGFPASTTVQLLWDWAGVPFTATTNAGGGFSASFTVPQTVAGAHTVTAAAGSGYATAGITVVPQITVNTGSGIAGTTASVSGTGFAPDATPTATFHGSPLSLSGPGSANTDLSGSFNDATFTIPSLTAGSYALTVTAGTGDTGSDTSFSVAASTGYANASSGLMATQQASTMSGLVAMSGSCSGCSKNEVFTVYVDGVLAVGTVETGSNKSWSVNNGAQPNFGLPAGIVNGTHQVTLVDTAGLVYGTTTLTLSTPLTPAPTSGAPGTSLTVNGAAKTVANGENYAVFFDSTQEKTGTASVTGTTSSTFTVPGGWGTHLVDVEQTNGAESGYYSPAVSFSVPGPFATPTGTFQSGKTITITGGGYADGGTLSATYVGSSVTLSSTSISSTGTFSVTFTLPTHSAGTYLLIVSDNEGNSYGALISQTG